MDFDFNRPLKLGRVTRETLAQALVQFRVARLPQLVADVDAREINVAMTEAQDGFSARVPLLNVLN
jgi:hypothetical protein